MKWMKFNLIVTTFRRQEPVAASELRELLSQLGDEEAEVEMTKISGLLTVRTSLNPFYVIEKVRALTENEPWRISSLLRFIPVEEVVKSEVEEIAEAVGKLAEKIPEKDSFRITVEKRHTQLSSQEIIKAAAEKVERRVDLKNPDWIILIEVLGGVTGVSVLRPDQILSTAKRERG